MTAETLHPPLLGALLRAARGVPDETVARLIDRWLPETPEPVAFARPVSRRRLVEERGSGL